MPDTVELVAIPLQSIDRDRWDRTTRIKARSFSFFRCADLITEISKEKEKEGIKNGYNEAGLQCTHVTF